ncbi:hypothetical protein SUGI_1515910 [Cryptomeria japonica]|uniref:Receptor ligand binding region domain-containing protein n=1 Tax=Cryptomeria japonica TaxID=3369 RepID=A0AAD3NPM2_CRYJA|nr:hypothetical protein SUGI_1515910 [Cryptomeria japonica]
MKKLSSRTYYHRCLPFLLTVFAIWAPHLVKCLQSKPPNQQPQVQQKHLPQDQQTTEPTSKNKQNERINLIESDENGLYLVGLFDVHHSNPRVPFKCGTIDVDAGEWQSRRPMQNMEAFLWAIEQVNADKSLLPGVQLGSLVMDTCSSFLRTNQQMANLLHGQQQQLTQAAPLNIRQISAIVVDNSDVHSVEAVTSMASALGVTTFVTQSRSTLLGELARKYRLAQPILDLSAAASALQSAAAGAPPVAPRLFHSSDHLMGARVAELERRSSQATNAQQFEGLLGELLGIGKMSTPAPPAPLSPLGDSSTAGKKSSPQDNPDTQTSSSSSSSADQMQKLLMVRMLLGNELIADSLAAFLQQMQWDFVSVIYDDELDMIDLHDELLRKLFAHNTQLALDEQIALGSSTEIYDKLLLSLSKKSTLGAKVVITLLGTGSSRALLDSLQHLRRSPSSNADQVEEINSLLWITVADREPYYSFATDALGTIAISSSVSLLPDFKSHYDKLENVAQRRKAASGALRPSINKWWPEYMKVILQRHQKDIELVSNECAKWQEPKVSPLNERCRALTLQALVQTERQLAMINNSNNNSKIRSSSSSSSSSSSPIRLSKYLAGGWEHNGMDVINSVLAVANGLESIRQALCPEIQSGLCERMRELIGVQSASPSPSPSTSSSSSSASGVHQIDQIVAAQAASTSGTVEAPSTASGGQQQQQQQLPLLSELMYNELLRSTFQLADGRMFNLDDFDSQTGGGQLEGKLKLYNLRYLQANSIGFVKFGTYDQQDGLLLNASKAMHYPNNSYLNQVPIERVKSSCRDETKCLMLSSYEGGSMNKQAISEEELALGVNSLFKLDHPMIMSSSSSSSQPQSGSSYAALDHRQTMTIMSGATANLAGGASSIGSSSEHLEQVAAMAAKTGKRQTIQEDSHIHTMRSAPFGISHFNQTTLSDDFNSGKQTFNTIVLLPLHARRHQSSSSSSGASATSASAAPPELAALQEGCSEQLDIKRFFQYLVALAYAQNLANTRHNPSPATTSVASAVGPKIELTTTVIDYCEQLEWAKTKLAAELSERQQPQQDTVNGRRQQQQVEKLPKQVAVIDFDAQIGEHIADLTGDRQLLHLTISAPSSQSAYHFDGRQTVTSAASTGAGKSKRTGHHHHHHHDRWQPSLSAATSGEQQQVADDIDGESHFKVSLLPSKSSEIQAIVKLISSMSQWKLVHLIYTDHHHYRDEFVRRANEANICVSKLIWIPSVGGNGEVLAHQASNEQQQQQQQQQAATNDSLNTKESQQLGVQVEKTKRLFARELHDYSNSPATNPSDGFSAAPNNGRPSGSEGLNSTRLLVVLASSSDLTNQLILEAASQSMLDDYVWITSHEWLASVELPAEQADASNMDSTNPFHKFNFADYNQQQAVRLPQNFISTRLETFESASFRHYFASLSPSIHNPIPTGWFDEFWQQHFQCRLPIVGSASPASLASKPLCVPHQHLDLNQIIEDDRVHYVIMAIQSIHEALQTQQQQQQHQPQSNNASASIGGDGFSRKKFANSFRQAFKRLTSGQATGGPLSRLPYGFHIVHRVLPSGDGRVDQNMGKRGQRQNSRDLSAARAPGQLLKVGLWRNGELILMRRASNESSNLFSKLNSNQADSQDQEMATKVAASLKRLGSIRSRCLLTATCSLCRQQVEQTKAAIELEEARYGQSQSVSEPNAISSIWTSFEPKQEQKSILDSVSSPTLESAEVDDDNNKDKDNDEGDNHDDDDDDDSSNRLDHSGSASSLIEQRQRDKNIEASAASLFDADTKRQVEERRQSDARRAYKQQQAALQQAPANQGRWSSISSQPLGSASFRQTSGVLMSILSLLGIVCMVASMTHLYPKMLDERKEETGGRDWCGPAGCADRACCHRQATSTPTTSSRLMEHQPAGFNNHTNFSNKRNSNKANLSATAAAACPLSSSLAADESGQPTLANINDYFLLTGLLMLCSINIAFLLPATESVCWLRRIGLATSYTIIFSSILVKVLASCRQSSDSDRVRRHQNQLLRHQSSFQSPSSSSSSSTLTPNMVHQVSKAQQVDPVDENVELTFESLPPDQGIINNQQEPNQLMSGPSIVGEHLSNAYQTQSSSSNNDELAGRINKQTPDTTTMTATSSYIDQQQEEKTGSTYKSSTLMTISISLILTQLAVSLIWLIQQPPEPTLYFACWRCASPIRSPNLFLYELLLSLLYPAIILIAAWIWAIVAFRRASRNEEQYRLLAAGGHLLKASASHRLQMTTQLATNGTADQFKQLKPCQHELDYRLRDAKSFVHSYGSHRAVLKFNQQQEVRHSSKSAKILNAKSHNSNSNTNSNKWLTADCDEDDIYPVNRRFPGDGSLFGTVGSTGLSGASSANERLRLQQFNTYGTYSPGASSNMASNEQQYRTSSSSSGAINPLSSFQTIASSLSAATSGGSKRARKFIGNIAGGGNKQDQATAGNHHHHHHQTTTPAQDETDEVQYRAALEKATRRQRSQLSERLDLLMQRKRANGAESKLQRRQSAGSVASSNAKLVLAGGSDNTSSILDHDDMDDTISCASSVASSSTSQLHGNDLYPIDCNIHLELNQQLPSLSLHNNESLQQSIISSPNNNNNNISNNNKFQRSEHHSFERRSLRRSMSKMNKELSSVLEEQVTDNKFGCWNGPDEDNKRAKSSAAIDKSADV